MSELQTRREFTAAQSQKLVGLLENAQGLLDNKACVYATGSFGRLEATPASDLDLFIVSRPDAAGGKALSLLDEICIKADLIESIRKLKIPDFDGDGKYLRHHKVSEFIGNLGRPKDDVDNTLTGRLLLFLESRPLLGEDVYNGVIQDVVAAYWRDYKDHKNDFVPAYLVNDILRLWRTFCVNYEAKTERDPEEQKVQGKIKNYKLKYSRMLTCYSALLYLVAVFVKCNTVAPEDAILMTQMTPTERLEWLLTQDHCSPAHGTVKKLLDEYERFLVSTNKELCDLEKVFASKEASTSYIGAGYKFGDLMFEAMSEIGANNRLLRLIAV